MKYVLILLASVFVSSAAMAGGNAKAQPTKAGDCCTPGSSCCPGACCK